MCLWLFIYVLILTSVKLSSAFTLQVAYLLPFFSQFHFCADPYLNITVYNVNFVCVSCMAHRLKVQTLAKAIFQIEKNKQQMKRRTGSLN